MGKFAETGTGVRLEDFMKEVPEKTLVHIGCADGFVCVVTPAEFKRHIAYWNEATKAIIISAAESVADKLQRIYNDGAGVEIYKDDNIRMAYSPTRQTEENAKEFQVRIKDVLRQARKAAEFVPFELREVRESTQRRGGGITAILRGMEHGRFWDRAEYMKGLPEELKNGADL